MFPGLRIDTTTKPIYKTSLSRSQIDTLKSQVADIDPDDNNQTQYEQIRNVVNQMTGKFENEYDQMEIAMLKTTLEAILDRGKRGSKPYELINVITKILDRITNTSSGGSSSGKRKYKKTRKTRRKSKR